MLNCTADAAIARTTFIIHLSFGIHLEFHRPMYVCGVCCARSCYQIFSPITSNKTAKSQVKAKMLLQKVRLVASSGSRYAAWC